METPSKDPLPPQPGLIASFVAGFELTANHVAVISLPVLLDLLLWLGPHIRIRTILRPLIAQMMIVGSASSLPSSSLSLIQQFWQQTADHFNLFTFLRTFPVGIPSLMSGQVLSNSPLNSLSIIDIVTWPNLILISIGLVLVGWIFGAVYYYWVCNITSPLDKPRARKIFGAILQTILLSLLMVAVIIALGFPIFMLISILALINPTVAQIVFLAFFFVIMWTLPLLFFSTHGIFTYQQNAFSSIGSSFRMVRFTLPTSGLFILLAFLLSRGLDFLWRVPPEDSWFTLVGIVGHGFIVSALIASSFVYYRNVNSWLRIVLERLKTRATSVSA
jgi:hypothetical protein